MATDLLSTICREIDERLEELRPLLADQQRLLVAAEALVDGHQDAVEAEAQVGEAGANTRARKGVSATRARGASVKAAPGKSRAKTATASRPKPASESAPQPKPERAARGAAREAILGALEHGSHTVGELVVVTAMSAPNINGNLRRLEAEGVVAKAEREGKAAWALLDVAA